MQNPYMLTAVVTLNMLLCEMLKAPIVTSDEMLALAEEMWRLTDKCLRLGAAFPQVDLAKLFPKASQEQRDALIEAQGAVAEDSIRHLRANSARLAQVRGTPKSERLKLLYGDGSIADLTTCQLAELDLLVKTKKTRELFAQMQGRFDSLKATTEKKPESAKPVARNATRRKALGQ